MSEQEEVELLFEDPPAAPTTAGSWGGTVAALRRNPNRWAKIQSGAPNNNLGKTIRGGGGSWAPKGDFEARVRKTEDGYDVYARCVRGEE